MPTAGQSDDPGQTPERASAQAELLITVQPVSIRAHVTVPGGEARGLLALGVVSVLELASGGFLGAAVYASQPGVLSTGRMFVVTSSVFLAIATQIGAILSVRLNRKASASRAYYSVSQGRPALLEVPVRRVEKPGGSDRAKAQLVAKRKRPTSYSLRRADLRRRRYHKGPGAE